VGPLPGLRLLANVYRVDDSDPHDMGKMAAWVPLGGDFHRLAGAGTLVLAGPDGQVPAPPPTRPRILPNGQFVVPPSPR